MRPYYHLGSNGSKCDHAAEPSRLRPLQRALRLSHPPPSRGSTIFCPRRSVESATFRMIEHYAFEGTKCSLRPKPILPLVSLQLVLLPLLFCNTVDFHSFNAAKGSKQSSRPGSPCPILDRDSIGSADLIETRTLRVTLNSFCSASLKSAPSAAVQILFP